MRLGQRFLTWGTPTPGGMQAGHRGYAGSSKSVHKINKTLKKAQDCLFGVRKGGKVVIRGYAEQENFDLGLCKH